MRIHNPLIAVEVVAPKPLNQLTAIPDAPRIAHKGGQQIKLQRG